MEGLGEGAALVWHATATESAGIDQLNKGSIELPQQKLELESRVHIQSQRASALSVKITH